MKWLWRTAKRRWLLLLLALFVLVVPAGHWGWNVWRRAAVQRALTLRIDRAIIDEGTGGIFLKMRWKFDSRDLPGYLKIACPPKLFCDPREIETSLHPNSLCNGLIQERVDV